MVFFTKMKKICKTRKRSASSASEAAKSKFKRPKVFAIRSFPTGFYRNPTWTQHRSLARGDGGEDDFVEPFEVDSDLEEVLELEEESIEQERIDLIDSMKKRKTSFKRRGVPVIRGFPYGCGTHAARTGKEDCLKVIDSSQTEGLDLEENEAFEEADMNLAKCE